MLQLRDMSDGCIFFSLSSIGSLELFMVPFVGKFE